ncbi:MAG: hypothetical protein KatS3mg068_2242 [Candidatus Sericytochromatia bacterium]|nr:MAG: hypothetical protein KatS3mg068_2242 [Candidatus Sericytochromatia bacterium]
MKINQFIDFLKKDFSYNLLEIEPNFINFLFYYKRNMKDFLIEFSNCNDNDKNKIIVFLLNLYPITDSFILEILKDSKFSFPSEISLDAINYISSTFPEDLSSFNIYLDKEKTNILKRIFEIRNLIEQNQLKIEEMIKLKNELNILIQKNDKLNRELKELENNDINLLRQEIFEKQKKYEYLKDEKEELKKQLDKINIDLEQLNKYTDIREKINQCREIIKDINFPKDYLDRIKMTDV